jgi:hypothetical protein
MTISPPDNVGHGSRTRADPSAVILASGIDSLDLAIDLRWHTADAFKLFAAKKLGAKASANDEPTLVAVDGGKVLLNLVMRPHGVNGYEWMLVGKEFTLCIGKWMEPQQRPSSMVSFRSEALWTYGPTDMVVLVEKMLANMGATVLHNKVSRIDLCTDILVPEAEWHDRLSNHFVSRAKRTAAHSSGRNLSGHQIGRGAISARIYDKAREIVEKSAKFWMFDIWGLPSVPEGDATLRAEFQLRRAALKQLGVDKWIEIEPLLGGLWEYCTEKWLRLVDDPALHHTQQQTLPWWRQVQRAIPKPQAGQPLVRKQAVNTDRRRLSAMSLGPLSSIVALGMSEKDIDPNLILDPRSFLHEALETALRNTKMGPESFTRRVNRKRSKYQRLALEFDETEGDPAIDSLESGQNPPGD